MIKTADFVSELKQNGAGLFAGVPDSLLKSFSAYLEGEDNHVICANEGAAVALAGGHYMTTGSPAVVYMQNSGFGNAVNPLLSLASPEVYGLPMVLLIGWRGEPGKHDEPQHVVQGRLMTKMLDTLEIPYVVIGPDTANWELLVEQAFAQTGVGEMRAGRQGPSAIVCQAGIFDSLSVKGVDSKLSLTRENAIQVILSESHERDVFVVTTGMASREVFEQREIQKQLHDSDFLTVGSMGHSNQIALAIARTKRDRTVYCIEGDGALIMHMGSLAICGTSRCENFRHIVLNNAAHDSVGGQPTVGFDVDFTAIALACNYKFSRAVDDERQLRDALIALNSAKGPAFLEVRVRKGARADLGRPTKPLVDMRDQFCNFIL